jgi:hypothetical protein
MKLKEVFRDTSGDQKERAGFHQDTRFFDVGHAGWTLLFNPTVKEKPDVRPS